MRIDKLLSTYEGKEKEPDFSVLSDSELDFYIETLEKAGYDWNKEGNLSLLSDEELAEIKQLTIKAEKAGSYAN